MVIIEALKLWFNSQEAGNLNKNKTLRLTLLENMVSFLQVKKKPKESKHCESTNTTLRNIQYTIYIYPSVYLYILYIHLYICIFFHHILLYS